jgi:hypothetical protein
MAQRSGAQGQTANGRVAAVEIMVNYAARSPG